MHLLRLFLAVWVEFGIVTVFFLYWLAKRTNRHINRLDKPVLDQDSFQQLLFAAYTLQEKNRSLVKEIEADSSQIVSLRPERLHRAESDREPSPSFNDSPVTSSRDRRISRSDEFFWRFAAAVATGSLVALLLVTSHDRFSPLPARLEVIQQEVPIRRVLPQSDGVGTKTIAPKEESVDRNHGRSVPAAAHKKKTVNFPRHSIYESEADLVAPDTVVRYSRPTARR